ncbi:MAG: VWA domain-containing protein [Deltaproteobacteria bacterium]|nr:VWA domain-containing protein [Deltaproteobacteria bacterium]
MPSSLVRLGRAAAVLAGLSLFSATVGCGSDATTADEDRRFGAEGASFSIPEGSGGSGAGPSKEGASGPDTDMSSEAAAEGAPGAYGDEGATAPSGGGAQWPVEAGTLTAGVWDDNLNFSFFAAYRDGRSQEQGLPAYSAAEQADAHARSRERTAKTALDIAFVIDTTGSMSDEIAYLQAEFMGLAATIEAAYPDITTRWALVAYRDIDDEYVLRGADFGTSAAWFAEELQKLHAGGGGDYPEAPDQALQYTSNLSWRDPADNTGARLAFWVADAPHHVENAQAMTEAVHALKERNVHIYPIASSGVDELTEYSMRAAAQLTLGRYIFLTDDSGVGNAHKEPSIPCYFVTRLDKAMVRVIASELEGQIAEIAPSDILRTGGTPTEGVCEVSSQVFNVF